MANDIKQKIVLEGEKEYNKALSDAKRNLKTLRSELKAETAELGANATAQQKNETRIKSLQKQIKEQEKVVKTYQAALKEVKEKYGDNADAVAKWEQRLNEARTGLANMKNELENVGKGFKDVQGNADMATVSAKSVADAFGNIGEIGGAISDSIEGIFSTLFNTLKNTLTEIWGMIADTAAKANNWTDLASYYGTTASEIERINYGVESAKGNFQDFTNLLNQLAWGGKGKKITEWFGISDVNYENKLNYAMDVLKEMQRLQNTDPGKLGDAMEDVFGAKKSQQILWFASNLDKIRENMAEFDEHGYSMGEDSIKQMNDVWTELGKIEEKWDWIKNKFAAGFGQVTLDIMANVNGGLDALMDYFNADNDEDREKALDELATNITEAFQKIADAITEGIKILDQVAENLKKSDNPTAKAIGTILSGIVDALKWLTEDNMKNVVTALEVFAAFWIAGNGMKLASTLSEVAYNLMAIKNFNNGRVVQNLLGGAGAGAGAGAAAGSGTGVATAAGGAASGIAAKTGAALAGAAQTAASVSTLAAVTLDRFLNETNTGRAIKNGENILEGIKKDISDTKADIEKNASTFPEDWSENVLVKGAGQLFEAWKWNGQNTADYWIQILDTLKTAEEYAEQMEEKVAETQKSEPTENWEVGEDWGIEEIMNWVEQQQNNQQKDGGNSGNTDGLTSGDAKNMTDAVNRMPSAVAKSVSGIRVVLDGSTVGHLVAPYVSQAIGASIV